MTSESARATALASVIGPYRALLLFGSHSRGDADTSSDIDVIQVVTTPTPSYQSGGVTFSVYTRERLLQMSRAGALFARHLAEEAQAIEDPACVLDDLRKAFCPAPSYRAVRNDVLVATAILDIDEQTFLGRPRGYAEAAKHLARTLVYTQLADRGELTFSWPKALRLVGADSLAELPRETADWRFQELQAVRNWLAEQFGCVCQNRSGTLDALIVNAHGRSELTVVLGLRILGASGNDPYEVVLIAGGFV